MPNLGVTVWAACCVSGTGAIRQRLSQVHAMSIAGIPVVDQHPADDLRDWALFFDEGTTDKQLSAFCSLFTECVAGHPEEGGIPFVAVYATDSAELEKVLSQRTSLLPSFISPDTIIEDDPMENVGGVGKMGAQSSGVWGVDRVGRGAFTGKGVHAYVLDSGVRSTHVDFGGRAIPTLEISTFGRVKECNGAVNCARDDRGHGTHCAGSVGGATYGVAPDVFVHAMDRGRSSSHAYTSMDWLAQKALFPAVLSMSFGSQKIESAATAAVAKVLDAGITVVVASGNWKSDVCQFTYAWLPDTISVAASTSTDARASFSNWGTCNTLFAPGEAITSTDYSGDDATSVKSGTSMATPHVTGAIALLLEAQPTLGPAAVKAFLLNKALQGVVQERREGDPDYLLQAPV